MNILKLFIKEAYAQTTRTIGQIETVGPVDPNDPAGGVGALISGAVKITFIVAGLTAFFVIITAGFQLISGGGDPQAVAAARSKIMFAFIGLIVVLASIALIMLVEGMFGLGLGFSKPIEL